jgi:gliding motility-associated-like protein
MYIVTTTELGCTSRDTVIITINPQPVASFVAPDPQCFSGNISDFESAGIYSGNATFDWQFGPWATPVSSTDPNPQGVTFNSTGIQIVTLVVTDRGCESNPYQAPVMIYKMPVANFVSDVIEGCDPKVINFSNLSEGSDNNTIKTYGWTFGNGRASTVVDPIILYNDPGSYDVSLTVTNERGCVDVYTIPNMIRIFPSPQAEFSLEPPMAYIVKPEIEVYNFAVGGNEVYYVVNGVDTIYQAEPKLIFSDSGTYNVRQIVVSSDGCMDSITKPAYIELGYKVYVPTAFTPNADGYNDLFKAYGEDIKEFSMLIYNRWGELLYSSFDYENGWDGRNRLNDEPAPGGVYVYKISTVQRNGLIGNYEGTVVLLR